MPARGRRARGASATSTARARSGRPPDLDPPRVRVGHRLHGRPGAPRSATRVEVYLNGVEALRVHHYRGDYGVFEVTPEARAAVRRLEYDRGALQPDDRRTVHPCARGPPTRDACPRRPRAGLELSASRGPVNRGDFRRLVRDHAERLMGRERAEELTQLLEARERLGAASAERMAYIATERGPDPPQMHVHVRGNALAKGEPVEPDWPHCMDDERATIPRASERPTSGRRSLARWLTAPDNALAARTAVNRIWAQPGTIVSVSDFGELGDRPTHPELLDWLAGWFLESGSSMKACTGCWSRRPLPSGQPPEVAEAADESIRRTRSSTGVPHAPDGAEEVRDSLLAVTDRLNPQRGGKPIFRCPRRSCRPPASRTATSGSAAESTATPQLYIKVKRSLVPRSWPPSTSRTRTRLARRASRRSSRSRPCT